MAVVLGLGQLNWYFRMGIFVPALMGNELYSHYFFSYFFLEEMKAADRLGNRVWWVCTESMLVSSSFSVMF